MDTIELSKKLISFKTTKDNLEEMKSCLEFVDAFFPSKEFYKFGFEKQGKPTLYVSTQETKEPKIMFLVHLDVVEGEEKQFTAREEGDRLYGRGSCDMKAQAAFCMTILKTVPKDKSVAVAFTFDEEQGGMLGAEPLSELVKPSFIICPDARYSLVVKEKGVMRLRVTASGKAAHGAYPWQGENAIENLIEAFLKIRKQFSDVSEKDNWKATYNLGLINGGEAPNKIPDNAELVLDIRYTEHDNPDELLQKISSVSDKISVERIEFTPSVTVDTESEIFKKFEKAVLTEFSEKPEKYFANGSRDTKWFSKQGVPFGIIGPKGGEPHSVDEWVSISSIKELETVFKKFVLENA